VSPTEVTGRMDSLSTMLDEGTLELGGREREREILPGLGVVWFDTLELATHSVSEDGVLSVVMLSSI
jgi:hypothetical protein